MYRILLIVKRRGVYSSYNCCGRDTGLSNSALFVVEGLQKAGLEAKLAVVTDNNDIDREVFQYKPSHVIIEALWVVPEKFQILMKLHPTVKWIVRLHSDLAFLAHEGIAMEWLQGYKSQNVRIGVNSMQLFKDLVSRLYCPLYLPNFYFGDLKSPHSVNKGTVNVGCFGAIRPMKNTLTQAIAALSWADQNDKYLLFHVSLKCEQGGEQVLKNLRGLFKGNKSSGELVEHPWMSHEKFLDLMAEMGVSLQCSFSETFNIVTGDAVVSGVPVVVSPEVHWVSNFCKADPNDADDIVEKMNFVMNSFFKNYLIRSNQKKILKLNQASEKAWLNELAL
jgi:hypothetical protein